jgi:hypothetical protein
MENRVGILGNTIKFYVPEGLKRPWLFGSSRGGIVIKKATNGVSLPMGFFWAI